ncbi:universal stress protein [Ornithinimicrobium ciconiae]|uniref:universal stress protein n=1 Tax=Ornithinimicrobium ciconiae TaxID=2594265 RepID=UPI0013FCFF20|nr:universal stress protein [Ornithinimicrobium ciconiae]
MSTQREKMMDRIVVGVDGSEGSKVALAWAVEEALLREATLELVNVYAPPMIYDGISIAIQAEELLLAPRRAAEALVKELAGGIDAVPVETHAIEDASAPRALVEHADGAAMLVVSARGLGPFRRMLLGSVSSNVAHHATCPVVIIPAATS